MALETLGLKMVLDGIESYLKGLDSAKKAEDGVSKSADSLSTSQNKVEKSSKAANIAMAAMGGSVLAGIGLAVKSAADFEHEISQVGAVSGATEKEMGQLSDTALRIGKDTSFSASQAASAMEELASQGVSTTDIINGAADATVNLAAAGGTDLVTAATAASAAMNIWGLSTDKLPDVVNRLAGAANVSSFNVSDMTEAMAAGGIAASTFGVNMEDTTTALAALSKGGFQTGSDAGTSFKAMLTSLAAPSSTAKDEIGRLGISVRDASGNMKPMSGIIDELHAKLDGLGKEDRDAAMQKIFGSDGMRAAGALMKLTGTQFDDLSNKMKTTDAAAIAQQRMDNFSGSLEALKGSLETVAITLGMKVLPVLNDVTQGVTGLVNGFGELPSSTQNILAIGAAITGLAPLAISTFEKGSKLVQSFGASLQNGKGQALAFAGGVTAIAVASDLILQKFTGRSLTDWIFGDVDRMERAEKSTERLQTLILGLGKDADPTTAALQLLNEATQRFGDVVDLNSGKYKSFIQTQIDNNKATKDSEEQTKAAAKAMFDAGADVNVMWEAYKKLPPDLQKAFDGITHVTDAIKIAHPEMTLMGSIWQDLSSKAVGFTTVAQAYQLQLDAGTKSTTNLGTATKPTTDYVKEFTNSVIAADNKIKAMDESIKALTLDMATNNPEVLSLEAANALLDKKIGDLKASTDANTLSVQGNIKALQDQHDANDKLIADHQREEGALIAVSKEVERLAGPAVAGGLLSMWHDLKVSGDDQVTMMGDISTALDALQNDNVPGAIAAFNTLKNDTLDPAQWAVVAKAIGPALMQQIADGIQDPNERAQVVKAANDVGFDLTGGVASGISNSVWKVNAAAAAVVGAIPPYLRQLMGIHSPSTVMAEEVGQPLSEGIALGITDGMAFIETAMSQLAAVLKVTAGSAGSGFNATTTETLLTWKQEFLDQIADGEGLTTAQIDLLFQHLGDIVTQSNLPQQGKQSAIDTINAMAKVYRETGSLASDEVIRLFDMLTRTTTEGTAKVTKAAVAGVTATTSGMSTQLSQGMQIIDMKLRDMMTQLQKTGVFGLTGLNTQVASTLQQTMKILADNLDNGKVLSTAKVTDLNNALIKLINESGLPQATKDMALDTMNSLIYTFQQTGSEANSELIKLLGILTGTAASGVANINTALGGIKAPVIPPATGGGTGVFTGAPGNNGPYGQTHYWNPETNSYQNVPYTGSVPQPKVTPNAPAPANPSVPRPDGTYGPIPDPYHDASGNTWSPAGPNGSRWTDKNGNYSDDGGKTWHSPGAPYAAAGNGLSVPSYDIGTRYVPRTGLALIHKGEEITSASAVAARRGGSGGGSGTMVEVTADLRGAQFTGTPQENASAIREVFKDLLEDTFGHGALIASGVRT